jgi:3-hydroxyisobutyrate dehydrogenase/2-hydroxy-3-oxopropionate reductase
MARRLLDAGHRVVVWNRTLAKTEPLLAAGAELAASPADAARRAEAVFTAVTDGDALRAVTEGREGIAAGAARVTVIEMSTVGPAAIARLAGALPPDAALVDAPVLGSLAEAEAGTLRIFVGGDEAVVAASLPLLEVLGSPLHVGPTGAGAAAKLVTNAVLFSALAALGEALALAGVLGLPRETAYELLAATPLAEQAARRRPVIESGDYLPRFPVRLAAKDANLIDAATGAAHVELPVTRAAGGWLLDADGSGLGRYDYTSVVAAILDRAQQPVRTPLRLPP